MATSIEMFLAGLALIINTLTILTMYFVGNLILGPLVNQLTIFITGPQTVPMSDMTYLFPAIWAILLCMEVIIIIAFGVVAARRTVVDDFSY
jgi:hypothetical protein